jgi:hypothetical protein
MWTLGDKIERRHIRNSCTEMMVVVVVEWWLYYAQNNLIDIYINKTNYDSEFPFVEESMGNDRRKILNRVELCRLAVSGIVG